jgi:predicted ATPase
MGVKLGDGFPLDILRSEVVITLIEALNFRSLKYISQPLDSFHVLVGPNASGKTTFLDVISFLSQLVTNGLDAAINERGGNLKNLLWVGKGNRFELAIEARIPNSILPKFRGRFDTIRYEIAVGEDKDSAQVTILEEKVLLKTSQEIEPIQRTLFPAYFENVTTIISKGNENTAAVVRKIRKGNDYFTAEFPSEDSKKSEKRKQGKTTKKSAGGTKGWQYAFKLGPLKSALGNLPSDESQFPATTWLRDLLTEGVQPFILNSILIRQASPPGYKRGFKPDGSNLPWVIDDLCTSNAARFASWIAHVQTALPDIENVRTIEREDDRHRYLVIKYKSGLEIPSWVVSDGTLRLLALTLPAYLSNLKGIYLIEEPENGIHPKAAATVVQSLSSVYDAQILMATHSPVILGITEANQILCFAKTHNGATDIVAGNLHPALKDWKGETNLGVLFASGVLG